MIRTVKVCKIVRSTEELIRLRNSYPEHRNRVLHGTRVILSVPVENRSHSQGRYRCYRQTRENGVIRSCPHGAEESFSETLLLRVEE